MKYLNKMKSLKITEKKKNHCHIDLRTKRAMELKQK